MPVTVELDHDIALRLLQESERACVPFDVLGNRILRLMLSESSAGTSIEETQSAADEPALERRGWYEYVVPAGVDVSQPGVYEWSIDGESCYVGFYTKISTATRAYENHVRRLRINAESKGSDPPDCRPIHHRLLEALLENRRLTLTIVENCPIDKLAERRAHIQHQRRLNGK